MKKYYIIIGALIFVAAITSCAANMRGTQAPSVTAYGAVSGETLT